MKPFMNEPQSTHPSTGSLYLYPQKADLKARRQSIYYELGELEKHSPVLKKEANQYLRSVGGNEEVKEKDLRGELEQGPGGGSDPITSVTPASLCKDILIKNQNKTTGICKEVAGRLLIVFQAEVCEDLQSPVSGDLILSWIHKYKWHIWHIIQNKDYMATTNCCPWKSWVNRRRAWFIFSVSWPTASQHTWPSSWIQRQDRRALVAAWKMCNFLTIVWHYWWAQTIFSCPDCLMKFADIIAAFFFFLNESFASICWSVCLVGKDGLMTGSW